MNRLKLRLAETVYRSSKREPLGKSYQRGYLLPEKVRMLRVFVATLRGPAAPIYSSTWRQAKTISGPSFLDVRQVTDPAFLFGVSSDKSEAAKALLYPHPDEAEMKVVYCTICCWTAIDNMPSPCFKVDGVVEKLRYDAA